MTPFDQLGIMLVEYCKNNQKLSEATADPRWERRSSRTRFQLGDDSILGYQPLERAALVDLVRHGQDHLSRRRGEGK
jgi:hypothetical protein